MITRLTINSNPGDGFQGANNYGSVKELPRIIENTNRIPHMNTNHELPDE